MAALTRHLSRLSLVPQRNYRRKVSHGVACKLPSALSLAQARIIVTMPVNLADKPRGQLALCVVLEATYMQSELRNSRDRSRFPKETVARMGLFTSRALRALAIACAFEVITLSAIIEEETFAKDYLLNQLEVSQTRLCRDILTARWKYEAAPSDFNRRHLEMVYSLRIENAREVWKNVTRFPWKSFTSAQLRWAYSRLSVLGKLALDDRQLGRYADLQREIASHSRGARVCQYKGARSDTGTDCRLSYSDLLQIISISENYEERRYYWQQWRRVAVKPSRKQFLDLLQLLDVEAKLNGFNSTTEYWIYEYEWETFHRDLESLWELTRPLYEQLHAFLRNGLAQKYGAKYVSSQGPVPAHLVGDLESESWFHETEAFWPPSYDTSAADLKLQKMSVTDIFKLAESFYTSLGFPPLPPSFWNNSVLEESPAESHAICDASAWDFCDGRDFRIRMCTEKSLEGLKGVFHEMGHVYYFQQYAGLPHVFRQGANPGFHEAVADAMAWLACSPQHLHKIGLLNRITKELDIGQLFDQARIYVVRIPSWIASLTWMWHILNNAGVSDGGDMEARYWALREALRVGASKSWTEVVFILTNGRTDGINASALLNYFAPLYEWLETQNAGSHVGW